MVLSIELAERGLVPSALIRVGIRHLLEKRLASEAARHRDPERALRAWVESMEEAPIAPATARANQQHYEVPADFFERVLGKQLKYSSAYWPGGVRGLDEAEEAMLRLTAERARLADGQRVLELGCGWGSLTLWMARAFPRSSVVAVSSSRSQREWITGRARVLGISNIEIRTADMNVFEPNARFDRIVSVEMFEHMRNWGALLRRAAGWMEPDGHFFLHVFSHRKYAYPFEDKARDDWMGKNFFSGGMMPSVDLLDRIASPFALVDRWTLDGTHYAKTAEAWLENLDAKRDEVTRIFARELGPAEARRQVERWRIFFLACAELFAYRGGAEWLVSHHLLSPAAGEGES